MYCFLAAAGWLHAEPAAAPVIDPAAGTELDAIRDAYAKLSSLKLSGQMSFYGEIMGKTDLQAAVFAGTFTEPNRFRHEIKDQALVISDGRKAYLFVPKAQKYVEDEAPADRAAFAQTNAQIRSVLQQQNPSLYLALSRDARAEILDGVERVSRRDDVQLDGGAFTVLELVQPAGDVTLIVDPQTHLLRQVKVDRRKTLEKQGVPAVASAMVTVDYTSVEPNQAAPNEQYTWSPPPGATPARGGDAGDGDQHPLQGKRAPDFTLSDLEDKPVRLADLKGSVVVLDFWATWCGPCREALPHLQKLQRDLGPQGAKFFAVNVEEPKEKAAEFVREQKLELRVLLDEKGETGKAFGVSGIPQTVVIGKNGAIQRILVGFDPATTERELREAISQALSGR
jgi:peroxiredoxin/outer membrane lipoprotein-sorting protein